jgi:Flp pilus assembly protein TadD
LKLQQEMLTLRPDDIGALNGAAWGLATTADKDGRYPQAKQAVQWARRANELAPNDASLLNTLGVALYRDEQWQDAIDALQKSIELGSDSPHNWLFLAMAHWQLDQKDQAKPWYDKSLAWQTTNAAAAKADAELQGFFTEAAKLLTTDTGQE